MELTKLQKLGISYIILDLMHRTGNMFLKHGGEIEFKNNPKNQTLDMWLYPYAEDGRIFHYTLEINEHIDDSIFYRFKYDDTDKLFMISMVPQKAVNLRDLC